MSLWPNATRILKSWGVLDAVAGAGECVSCFTLLRDDGARIASLSLEGFDTPALCVHRADLHGALRAILPPELLRPGRQVSGFRRTRDGVRIDFDCGDPVPADALVGADGVRSVVRSRLHGRIDPVYRGYRIWRGIADRPPGMPPGHISEIWGHGARFGILPMGARKVCWYATRNYPRSAPGQEDRCLDTIRDLFARWPAPVGTLLDATDPGTVVASDARDRRPLARWGRGRVTLLGDAVHPMTPNVGQGACMAIEDAACLARAVSEVSPIEAALWRYESSRKLRTALIGLQSRAIGRLGQWEHPWLVAARNWATTRVFRLPHDLRNNPVYAYQV
jgi:2-polyprenyl-6-methoxyphenol hydroxylase-like FAD-dependent oxidoreductase